MLDERQMFKAAFMRDCIERGYTTPQQMLGQVKEAQGWISRLLGGAYNLTAPVAQGTLGTAAQYGIPLALAAPPILGGTGGYLLARATDIDETDVSEAKNKEVIEELRRQTERLRRQRQAQQYEQQRRQTGRLFT